MRILRLSTSVFCAALPWWGPRAVFFAGAFLAAALLPDALTASTVRYRTDAELVMLSERVVYGRVIGQRTARPEESGPIYTVSTIAVVEDLTGRPGDSVEVWELGGVYGDEFMFVGGAVEYAIGSDVLVFLERGRRGLRSVAMGFSKFNVVGRTGREPGRLLRGMKDTDVVGGGASRSERSLDDFRALTESITGRRSRRALPAALLEAGRVVQPYTLLGNLRWTQADTGTPVLWYKNVSASPPTFPSDAVADIQTALAAWTNPSSASIVLQYAGETLQNQPSGQTGDADGPWNGISSDGTGVITFDDPDEDPDLAGSVIAIGGGYGDYNTFGNGGTVNGTTFNRFTRGYVIFREDEELCAFGPSFCQPLNFTRVLTHEIGHAIGLGHTEDSVPSPGSNIMFASCCDAATPVPPALGPDDLAGLNFIYPPCSFTVSPLSASHSPAASSGTISVTTASRCAWTSATSSGFVSITGGSSGTGDGTVSYTVAANSGLSQRSTTLSVAGQTVTITQNGTGPLASLDRSSLQFSATSNGAAFTSQTAAQTVRLTMTGGTGTIAWTATSNQPWLVVSPSSGSGTATLTVRVVFSSPMPTSGMINGLISLALTGAGNAPGPLPVNLTIVPAGASTLPFGVIETPLKDATGVTGSVPITGWALDDVEVASVKIYRDPVSGEGGSLIPVGDAVFVDGARGDVAAAYPAMPRNTRAGWGYLLLTNVLPNQGNGTFTLRVYAVDRDLGQTLLGIRTITCANRESSAPFGAIDTPTQGQTVSGSVNNFGWVLVPGTGPAAPRADVPGGGSVSVVIDGAVVGVPGQWTSRSDISTLFPTGFSNLASTLAVHTFDTTTLSNGVHTIAWGVTATNAQGAGIGSRYFTVSNGAAVTAPVTGSGASVVAAASPDSAVPVSVDAARSDRRAITGRRGFVLDAPLRQFHPDAAGLVTVQSEEIDRVELTLADGSGHLYRGYLRSGGVLTPLPVGSQLEASTGTFTWQPGVGFVGPYDFVFLRCSRSGSDAASCLRQDVRIVLNPKASGRVGPQVIIDTPTRQQDVGQPFVIAGWAIDLDQDFGSGVDAVHVWAYPLTGADPVFLGAAGYGGARPDVAALHGDRFAASGYGLTVAGLTPGNYDLAVFAWSTATGGFVPASTVRVTVR